MMIIWGKTRKLKKIGYVADFCPICRAIRSYELKSVSITNHLYYFPVGEGKVIDFIGICQDCTIERSLRAQKYPRTLSDDPNDIHTLIAETNPDILEVFGKRLELEENIKRQGRLDKDEREFFITEPFEIIGPMLEQRFGESTKFDKKSGRSCAITIAIPFVFLCISLFIFNQLVEDLLKILAAISVIIGIIITVVFIFSTRRRYLQNVIYPALARSLDPLDPSYAELKTTLDRYKNLGLYIGKKVEADQILNSIQDRRASKYDTTSI